MSSASIINFEGSDLLLVPHMKKAFRFRLLNGGPYIILKGLKKHFLAWKSGEVPLHRYLLFEHLGKPEKSPCNWCGHPLPWKTKATEEFKPISLVVNVDHVDFDPTNNDLSNLVPSCAWCNTSRGWARFYPELWEKWLCIMGQHPPQFRAPMREIAEEEGYPNPYEKKPVETENNNPSDIFSTTPNRKE